MRICAVLGFLVLVILRLSPVSWAAGEAPPVRSEELEIARLTNQEREAAGIPPAVTSLALVQVARGHSKEMMELGFFGHESPFPGHRLPWDRVSLMGVRTSRVAENVFEAEGYPVSAVPKICVRHWMSSHGHRVNILENRNLNVGVGLYVRGDKVTVTQVFCGEITDN